MELHFLQIVQLLQLHLRKADTDSCMKKQSSTIVYHLTFILILKVKTDVALCWNFLLLIGKILRILLNSYLIFIYVIILYKWGFSLIFTTMHVYTTTLRYAKDNIIDKYVIHPARGNYTKLLIIILLLIKYVFFRNCKLL